MKELQLPKAIPIRFYYDGEKPKTQTSGEVLTELAVIEKNGLEILSATIMIEERIIEATGKILFGSKNENQNNREFFENEIMATSDFPYSFKRRAFTRLLEQQNVI